MTPRKARRPADEGTTAVDGMVLVAKPNGYWTDDGRFLIQRPRLADMIPASWAVFDRTNGDRTLVESLSAAVRLIREAREDSAIEAAS